MVAHVACSLIVSTCRQRQGTAVSTEGVAIAAGTVAG